MLTTRKISDGEREKFNELEGQFHYLGETRPAGDSLQMVFEQEGRWVALMSWGSACYKLKHRDEHIGWTASLRAARQKLVVQQRRFTLLSPKGAAPNLASQCLGLAARELPRLWRETHGYEPLLAETFSDMEPSAGTCYRAAGWTPLGVTKGYSRSKHTPEYYVPNDRPKKLWVKPLRPDACETLCAARLPPECESAAHSDNRGVAPLSQTLCESLHDALCRVPDPRRKNRHLHIGTLLTLVVHGVMAGQVSLAGVVRHAETLTHAQRVAIALPRFDRKGGGNHRKIPSYTGFRHLLKKLDPDAFANALCAWIRSHEGTLPRQLALDGKFIRGVVGIVSLADAETGVPVAMARASQKEGEGERCELKAAQKLLRETDLTGALVSFDALHCQQETVRETHLSGGDALVQVKANQAGLLAACERVAAQASPLLPRNRNLSASMAAKSGAKALFTPLATSSPSTCSTPRR